jgi:hypothetical protein
MFIHAPTAACLEKIRHRNADTIQDPLHGDNGKPQAH